MVRNPEDRFSRLVAHKFYMISPVCMYDCKPKKYFSHRGGGGGEGEYVSISSNAYSDLYDINSM